MMEVQELLTDAATEDETQVPGQSNVVLESGRYQVHHKVDLSHYCGRSDTDFCEAVIRVIP